ncbi:MAG: flagellar motor switch protein FliM [Acidobacteriota bacterium]|jgi:flagellar motor switch protein FliM|nr:flagellar motor switch protein FliM [Acidobacteriota bacterium]
MEKVLSQDEINALFSAMSSDDSPLSGDSAAAPQGTPATATAATPEAPAEKRAPERKIAIYDFHHADRISQDQMRSLHMLHEAFGRNFAASLSAYLRAFVDVSLKSIEQVSYADFIKPLPDPTLFTSIAMRPLDGNMALELNPSLVFPMIDMILGGPGCTLAENRNLTEIELNIIEGVVKLAMRDLREAWHAITDFDFVLDGKGTKPQMFQIVSTSETVIAISLELKIGDFSGLMNLCIPSRVLKLLRSKFDQQWQSRRHKSTENEAERIMQLITAIPVAVSGEIKDCSLTVNELLKVAAGDVIELDQRIGDPIRVCVGGIEKYMGRIVQRRGKIAIEVQDAVGA